MINRGGNYQEHQMQAAVQAVAAELVNNEFNVIDVNVDRKMFSLDGWLVARGYVELRVDNSRVYVDLTSPDGIVLTDRPDVYSISTNVSRVVKEQIMGIVTAVVEQLIVDYGGL